MAACLACEKGVPKRGRRRCPLCRRVFRSGWEGIETHWAAERVLAVAHGFGGPSGDLAAPLWALGALAATALACAVAIVATAALFVIDVREAEDEP